MTRDELLSDRTDEPVLTAEQYERALLLAVAEVKAEGFMNRRRRRGRRAKPHDLGLSDDASELYTAAELLSGAGG